MSSILTTIHGEEAQFGEVLRKYRKRTCLSQAELGAEIGVTGSYVGKIERGQKPNGNQGLRLLVALGFTLCPAVVPEWSVLMAPGGGAYILKGDQLSDVHLEVSRLARSLRSFR